jgi:hypothetical protein
VQRDQGLVGGDHVLAVGDGPQHQLSGRGIAADQFDDDVHLGIIDDGEGIVADAPDLIQPLDGGRVVTARRGMGDADLAPGAPGDLAGVAIEHGCGTAADGAEPQ